MESGIYRFINSQLNKEYVGKAADVVERVGQEWDELRNGTHHNLEMQRDFLNQKGVEFSAEWIEKVTVPNDSPVLNIRASLQDTTPLELLLSDREKHHIQIRGSMYPNGYNQRIG